MSSKCGKTKFIVNYHMLDQNYTKLVINKISLKLITEARFCLCKIV